MLGGVLVLLTWPVLSVEPSPGLDPSWVAALNMAADRGLKFGPDLMFTYGPLGFLTRPGLYYAWTMGLAELYTLCLQLALCLTVLWALRRVVPLPAAFLLAFLAVPLIGEQAIVVVALIWAFEALRRGGLPIVARLFPIVGGAVAGLQLLVKLNTAFSVLAICVLAVLAPRVGRARRGLVFLAAFVVSLTVCWFAAGQSVGNVGTYVARSEQIVSGYSAAMIRDVGPRWELWLALLGIALVFVLACRATARAHRRASLAVWAVPAFLGFKEGFVRFDPGHAASFFGLLLGAFVALTWRRARIGLMLIAAGATAVVILHASGGVHDVLLRPGARADAAADQLALAFDGGLRGKRMRNARRGLQNYYGLSPAALAQVRGRPTAVLPTETMIVWAYRLPWRTVPVFQTYSAYTATLDQANARALESTGGPKRVLLSSEPPLDNRNPQFESPGALRALLCNFRPRQVSGNWLILARTARRCGPPKRISSRRARFGQPVVVPTPTAASDLVFVRIHGATPSGIEWLRQLLYRAFERRIHINGTREYRLVPGTAGQGLLMSLPPGRDLQNPFALSPSAHTVSVTQDGGGSSGPVLTYDFFEMNLRP